MNRTLRARSWILACLTFLMIAGTASAGSGKIHKFKNRIENEYIVVLEKNTPKGQVHSLAARLSEEHGGKTEKVWSGALKGFFVRMTEKEAERLSRHPAVVYVEENAALTFDTSYSNPTNVDPSVCDPSSPGGCSTTTDDRLWHLDRIDQDSAALSNTFAFCKTGSGVNIYIVDSGVHGDHQEFEGPGSSSRVTTGYNASGDPWPADEPCGGWIAPAVSPMVSAEEDFELGQYDRGHGTGTASLAAGNRVGIAKNATIIPVKVARCDRYSFRYRQPGQTYAVGDMVFDAHIAAAYTANPNKFWIATVGGTAANAAAVDWVPSGG